MRIFCENDQEKSRAKALSQLLRAPLVESLDKDPNICYLHLGSAGLKLIYFLEQGWTELSTEFLRGPLGYRRKQPLSFKQGIARAVGLKTYGLPLTVLDAMAGLGKDAFILAALGCQVTLVERSPLIWLLLTDGLARAKQDPELQKMIEQNMQILQSDAITVMNQLAKDSVPDIIYLDPMFPERNKSALTKSEVRVLRELVGEDRDAGRVLQLALTLPVKRVVVKRPRAAATLTEQAPDLKVEEKTIRYDVYLGKSRTNKT